MDSVIQFEILDSSQNELCQQWQNFLKQNSVSAQDYKVTFSGEAPLIQDAEGRKFQIDFESDSENYSKKKGSMTSEPLSRALGAGKFGHKVLDLSAGLGVDAVFLAQLGYDVTAIERNPLIYLALSTAHTNLQKDFKRQLQFIFAESSQFLKATTQNFDVCYFDPMFPDKKKSALPKQEMVLFKNLVGHDVDAQQVVETILAQKKFKRLVVKRPLKAAAFLKPSGQIEGKTIRYDIYGAL